MIYRAEIIGVSRAATLFGEPRSALPLLLAELAAAKMVIYCSSRDLHLILFCNLLLKEISGCCGWEVVPARTAV